MTGYNYGKRYFDAMKRLAGEQEMNGFADAVQKYEQHCLDEDITPEAIKENASQRHGESWHLGAVDTAHSTNVVFLAAIVIGENVIVGKALSEYVGRMQVLAANAEAFRTRTLPELKKMNGVPDK